MALVQVDLDEREMSVINIHKALNNLSSKEKAIKDIISLFEKRGLLRSPKKR